MYTLVELLGGVALLLWGLRMVRTGIMRAYGASLNRLASRSEGRVIPALFSGLVAAAVLQSSAATAMIAASFAGRMVISVHGAFFIMLGADIGTALAVLLASQKITWLAPVLLIAGVFGFLSTENHKARSVCRALIGLGLLLFALSTISQLGAAIFQGADFRTLLGLMIKAPFLLVLFAVILTYLAHSSLAILLLTIGLVQSGFVEVASALYLVLGANIGSGMLPAVANLNGPRNARIPVNANFILRSTMAIAGYFAVVPFILEAQPIISPSLMPAAYHLALNLVVVFAGIVLNRPLVQFAQTLLPESAGEPKQVEAKHLDETKIDSPAIALACARREALHQAEIAQEMFLNALPVLKNNDGQLLGTIIARDNDVDRLYDAIKIYIARVMQHELSEEESERAQEILGFTSNMEHVGDIVEGGLMEMAAKKIKLQVQFSQNGLAEIESLHELVAASFDLAINTFVSGDVELARQLYDAKNEIRDHERTTLAAHFERLGKGQTESIASSSLHLDLVRDLKRINSHLTAIAYPVLKASGEVPKTKWKRKG